MSSKDVAIQYANDIVNEKIKSGKYLKLTCKNFLDLFNREDLEYKENEVEKVVEFVQSLFLTEEFKNEKFILQPWQTFIIVSIYGFYYKGTDKRKVRTVYLELARKQGKSQLISALATYHFIFDVEAQVVVSHTSKEMAKTVNFKKCKQFCEQIDSKKKHLKPYYNSIKYKSNELLVVANEAGRLNGLSISTGILDELMEAPSSEMFDVIRSSMGSRRNPLLITITTAGFDTDSFCYNLRSYNIEVLEGKKKDDSQLTFIYSLDEGDDFTDKSNWIKCNPNLGVSIYEDYLENEVNKAIQNPVESSGIKVKNFNIWLPNRKEEQKYIEMEFVNKSMQNISITDERFEGVEMWAGVDLAAVSDITAVSYMFQLDEYFYFFNKYFLPEHSLNSNKNRLLYKQWAEQGYINITEGNVTDYQYILKDVVEKNNNNEIIQISYDSWNATQWAIDATNEGLILQSFSQSTGSINKPTKELSRLIMSGRVIMEYNPITQWMFNNVILKEYNGNIRPDKSSRSEKIDGVMAMLMCLGGYLNSPKYSFNVY